MERLDDELAAQGVVAAGIGETADLGGGLLVRPLLVAEDSRCPGDAQCIWAGRVRLRVNASGAEIEMIAGEPVSTTSGSVVLAVVSPGKWSSWPANELGQRPAYRFGFRRASSAP